MALAMEGIVPEPADNQVVKLIALQTHNTSRFNTLFIKGLALVENSLFKFFFVVVFKQRKCWLWNALAPDVVTAWEGVNEQVEDLFLSVCFSDNK